MMLPTHKFHAMWYSNAVGPRCFSDHYLGLLSVQQVEDKMRSHVVPRDATVEMLETRFGRLVMTLVRSPEGIWSKVGE